MNILDAAIICILTFCAVRGLFRGLIREVASIVGILAAFYSAFTYYLVLAPIAARWPVVGEYSNLAAFFILFLAVFIGVQLLAMLIRYLMNIVFLGWVDRLFGMVFGALKGGIVISVLFITLTTFLPQDSGLLARSRLSPHVADLSEAMSVLVSRDVRQEILLKLEGWKNQWENHRQSTAKKA